MVAFTRCATGALLTLVVAIFVAYGILMSLDIVLVSSWFQKLAAVLAFPYISTALQSVEEEGSVSWSSAASRMLVANGELDECMDDSDEASDDSTSALLFLVVAVLAGGGRSKDAVKVGVGEEAVAGAASEGGSVVV